MRKPPLVPADFGVALDKDTRRPRRDLLVGGAPLRLLRLSPAGATQVDRWSSGAVAGRGKPAALARRLYDAGIAHPRPPARATVEATIVIPVRDDQPGLDATLKALDGDVPLVVVDDGSTPPIEACGARVIRHDETLGPAAARNKGWRFTRTEIVVFLDAGCEPPKEWLAAILPHFSDPAVGAVAPRIVPIEAPRAPGWLLGYEHRMSSLDLGAREAPVRPGSWVPYVPSAALAIRRSALEEAGGFDESLRYGEDVDLVWRLHQRGWRTRYLPEVEVGHPVRAGLRQWLLQRYHYGSSAAPLAIRHGRDVAPLAVSPWSALAWGMAAAGQLGPAIGVAASTAIALALRSRDDREAALTLAGLAAIGNLRAGAALATVTRRSWLPPALLVAALSRRLGRRSPTVALVIALVAPLLEWHRETAGGLGPLRWLALRLADDLAYQSGVWSGVLAARSPAALLPNW